MEVREAAQQVEVPADVEEVEVQIWEGLGLRFEVRGSGGFYMSLHSFLKFALNLNPKS